MQKNTCQTSADNDEVLSDEKNDSIDNTTISLNHPHPSLEFPPLYFAIRNSPRALERMKGFYAWRWRIAYPLQKRIPLSKYLRFLRIYLTYGEVLILVPLVVLAVVSIVDSFFNPDVRATGKASRFSVAAALLFGQKNSYLTLVLGVPFERALFFHKLSGYIALVTGILHGLAYGANHPDKTGSIKDVIVDFFGGRMNTSGTMILIFIFVMYLTSIPSVRTRMYELFYYVHLLCLVGIVGGTMFHTGPMVPLFVFCTTGFDFMVRKLYMSRYRYPKKAYLNVVSDSVVEVTFPKLKGFDYNPGQYVYLAVPEISLFEWHPFSLCSSPNEPDVYLYIRVAGTWTAALHVLAHKQKEVAILLDGPYGNFGIDLADKDRYRAVMLVGGGIGVTPLQSICTHLMSEHHVGVRKMKKLKFVLIERDPLLMAKSEILNIPRSSVEKYRSQRNERDRNFNRLTLASILFSSVPPGLETDEDLEKLYKSFDLVPPDTGSVQSADETLSAIMEDDDDSVEKGTNLDEQMESAVKAAQASRCALSQSLPTVISVNSDSKIANIPSTLQAEADLKNSTLSEDCEDTVPTTIDNGRMNLTMPKCDLIPSESVLDYEIYLTCEQRAQTLFQSDMNLRDSCVKVGRPDLAALFSAMRQEAIALGERRVAVCVCGPRRIVHLCRQACIQLSDDKVRFDYHVETYG